MADETTRDTAETSVEDRGAATGAEAATGTAGEDDAAARAPATSAAGATDGAGSTARNASGETGRRPRRGRLVVVVILVVVLLAACGYLGYRVWQDRQHDDLRRTAAEEASRLVVQLATYDHTDVDANLEAVTAEATPEFAERYREVSAGLAELLRSGEGTSTGTVSHAAVESVDDQSAVVLVFLDQEITNVTVPEGRVDASRMVVGLTRDGDRWLLDSADVA